MDSAFQVMACHHTIYCAWTRRVTRNCDAPNRVDSSLSLDSRHNTKSSSEKNETNRPPSKLSIKVLKYEKMIDR